MRCFTSALPPPTPPFSASISLKTNTPAWLRTDLVGGNLAAGHQHRPRDRGADATPETGQTLLAYNRGNSVESGDKPHRDEKGSVIDLGWGGGRSWVGGTWRDIKSASNPGITSKQQDQARNEHVAVGAARVAGLHADQHNVGRVRDGRRDRPGATACQHPEKKRNLKVREEGG